MDKNLAENIQKSFEEISEIFGQFQMTTGLHCREACGKCCFKPDIFCAPIELLPLGLKLIEEKRAEEILAQAISQVDQRCLLMNMTDEEKGLGRCSEYRFRPYVCRTFGVAARKDKYGLPDFSICKVIKEDYPAEHTQMLKDKFQESELPYIELWRKKIDSLDPKFLDEQYPINKSLAIILEKLLLIESLRSS